MLGSGYYALRVRFGATLRFALPNGMLRIPHASCILMFYLVFIRTLALPYLILIIKYLQGKNFLFCFSCALFILFYIDFQAHKRLNLEYMYFIPLNMVGILSIMNDIWGYNGVNIGE
ncbi:MAG: hypothetical protein NZ455_11250 [Bacteroidia bacterium]|nr:hypothetical protein [Bacteroidia bacterium]